MSCMKITVNQDYHYDETEVIINCRIIDKRLEKLLDTIRQYTVSLDGKSLS